MMRIVTFLFPLLCLFSALPAAAAEVGGLYEADVAVADRSGNTRRGAVAEALNQVLVKLSGDAESVNRKPVEAAAAERYLQQYQYREAESEGTPQLVLRARFDADGVRQLLRERGLPVWGSTRPLTLVWLAVEDNGQRELIGANDGSFAHRVLKEAGERRGLPVRLPLLDLTDRSRVRPADIWGDFHQPIVEMSKRYNPQAVLVGRLFPSRGARWISRWSLYQGNRQFRWEGEGEDRRELVALGVEGAAERLSRTFSDRAGADEEDVVELIVSGVGGLSGYRRVMDYLGSLDAIGAVTVAGIRADRLHLRLQMDGGPERLVNTLALGDTLAPEAVSAFDTARPPGAAKPFGAATQPEQSNQSEQPAQSQAGPQESLSEPREQTPTEQQPEQGFRRALLYRLVP